MIAQTISVIICVAFALSNGDEIQVDRNDWIDPNDMLRFDLSTNQLKKASVQSRTDSNELALPSTVESERLRRRILELQSVIETLDKTKTSSPTNDAVVFTHLLRKLSEKFLLPGQLVAEMNLNPNTLKMWKEYLEKVSASSTTPAATTAEIVRLADSIADIFARIDLQKIPITADPTAFDTMIQFLQRHSALINFCIVVPSLIVLFHRSGISRCQFAMWSFFILFFTSVGWTWIFLYQSVLAEQRARHLRRQHAAEQCFGSSDGSVFRAISSYVGRLFSFSNDPCLEYAKDEIDPIWSVTPMEAVSVTVVKLFVVPLEHIGRHLSLFFTALLQNLPIYFWPIVLPVVFAMAIIILLVCFGYSFDFFFGLFRVAPTRWRRPAPSPPTLPPVQFPSKYPPALAPNRQQQQHIPALRRGQSMPMLPIEDARR